MEEDRDDDLEDTDELLSMIEENDDDRACELGANPLDSVKGSDGLVS
jgi:hypothetical protein